MANGLMEFAEGFATTFGEGIAQNIRQRDKEERQYVRENVSQLRQRIANGRAKEAQIKTDLKIKVDNLRAKFPGMSDEEILEGAVNPGIYKDLLEKFNIDEKRFGDTKVQDRIADWYRGGKGNPYDPDANKLTAMRTADLVSSAFAPVKIDPAKPVEEDSVLKILLGSPTSPEKLLDQAERRVVSQRGIGAFDAADATDLDRYYARGGTVRTPTATATGSFGMAALGRPDKVTPEKAPAGLLERRGVASQDVTASLGRSVSEGFSGTKDSEDKEIAKGINKRLKQTYKQNTNKEVTDVEIATMLKKYNLLTITGQRNIIGKYETNIANIRANKSAPHPEISKDPLLQAYIDLVVMSTQASPDFKGVFDRRSKMRDVAGLPRTSIKTGPDKVPSSK